MKFSLIFALIVLLLVQTNTLKAAPKCNPLTLRCRCSNVKQIVCGVSGKTHTNPCIANCFGDKVKHNGPCTNQCKSTKQKCSWKSFGTNGGRRMRCCDSVKVCFGKTCTKSEKNCKWKGDVVLKKKRGHCYWKKKSANKYQRICCKWAKICKGSCLRGTRRCYTTLKRCKWTGRVINTKRNRKCSFINTINGKRRRCCDYVSKCINYDRLTCKSRRKPKCWATRKCKMVGPFIKRRCSRKCQFIHVGKFGKRRRCCHSCRTCKTFKFTATPNKRGDVCERKLNKCVWRGPIIVVRRHRKCSIKPYGQNKDRKRCCKWAIRCVGKHCKIVHKRCTWVGCVIETRRKRLCRYRMKNDHQKQRFCCSFTRRCCGSKCKNYNQKCAFVGKIITTHHHWRCRMVQVGKNGKKRKCCRFTRVCLGKKCQIKTGKCVFKGCLKTRKIVRKCSLKKLTKNIKCRYCCQAVKKCDCGLCRVSNTKCKCTKRYSYFKFTKCKLSRKRKGVKQQRCCVYKRVCRNKKCRVLKTKKCKWTGFEIVVEKKFRCSLKKTSKFGKKRYCCFWIRKCHGLKCKNTKRKCKFVGKEIEKKVVYRCKIRKFKKNASRKRCCGFIKVCIGARCRKLNKKCKWVGHIFRRKVWRRTFWRRVKKFCHRKQVCTFRQHCLGSKCTKAKRSCRFVGKAVCRYRRVLRSWTVTRKGCKLRKLCVLSTVCLNNECKSTKPKCRNVGKEICQKSGRFCKWSQFKGNCYKKRCCNFTSSCVGQKCTRKLSACAWKGKERCKSFTYKCKVVRFRKSFRRNRCCKFVKTCVEKKCKTRTLWCKWRGSSHKFKIIRKCAIIPIKKHKYIMIKRKRCSLWRKQCVNKRCKVIKFRQFWVGKKIVIRRFRKCALRKFSRKYNRSKCCRFTRVCVGKKCKDLKRGCFWYGRKILIKLEALLRWKVICRDVPFGKRKNIRLNCCKVQQRCIKQGPAFRCENIKRSKCWWRGQIRGDVWIQDQNGEWVEVNAVGTFRYLNDKENGIKIDTQFTQFGSGSITSSIVINARKNIIKANADGSVLINGVKQQQKKGTLLIRFIHNKIVTRRIKGKSNLTIIRGLTDDRLGFEYEKASKSYGLSVVSSELSTGLFVDPENPKKYQLKAAQSKFDKFVDFKIITPTEGTKEERKRAMECCHLLDSEVKVNQCISDYIRTKTCMIEEYSENNPNQTFFK